jgi:hypothetical protein
MDLWGFRLRRDGKIRYSLSGSHHPRLSEKFVAASVFIDAFEIHIRFVYTLAQQLFSVNTGKAPKDRCLSV